MGVIANDGFILPTCAAGRCHNNSQWKLYSHHAEELTYVPEMSDNDMIKRKVCVEGNKLFPGKEWRLHAQ